LQYNKLTATQFGPLTPISDDIFSVSNNRLVIKSNSFLFITSEKDSAVFTRVEEAKLDQKAMSEYAGEYYSEEAEAKIYIQVENGKLMILQKPKKGVQLIPTYKDGFDAPRMFGVDYDGSIYFERDKNKIISFKVSIDRARNVKFKKIK